MNLHKQIKNMLYMCIFVIIQPVLISLIRIWIVTRLNLTLDFMGIFLFYFQEENIIYTYSWAVIIRALDSQDSIQFKLLSKNELPKNTKCLLRAKFITVIIRTILSLFCIMAILLLTIPLLGRGFSFQKFCIYIY